jgi:glycine cleavage system H lipoate-binding protein
VNDALQDNLDDLKEDLSKGWIIRVKMNDATEAAALMDKDAYEKFTESLS